MTIALEQFLDPANLTSLGAYVALFLYFDRRTRRLEEKVDTVLGRLEGNTRVVRE